MNWQNINDPLSPNGRTLTKVKSSIPIKSVSTTNSTSNTVSSTSNFISLSKLKNYVPKNRSSIIRPYSRTKSDQSQPRINDNTVFNPAVSRRVKFYSQHSRKDTIGIKLEVQSTKESQDLFEKSTGDASAVAVALNQLKHCMKQQNSEQPQKQLDLHASSSNGPPCVLEAVEKFEEVESSESIDNQLNSQSDGQPQQHSSEAVIDEERERIESSDARLGSEAAHNIVETNSEAARKSCGKYNMTPSSLLLIRNRNYIERQHQSEHQRREQVRSIASYNTPICLEERSISAAEGNNSIEYKNFNRQVYASAKSSDEVRYHELAGDNRTVAASASLNRKLLSSSDCSLMRADTNHFKISANQNSNSSSEFTINNINNQNSTNFLSANKPNNQSEIQGYSSSSNDDLTRIQNHRSNNHSSDNFDLSNSINSNYTSNLAPTVHYYPTSNPHRIQDPYAPSTNHPLGLINNSIGNISLKNIANSGPNAIDDNRTQNHQRSSVIIDQYYSGHNNYNLTKTTSSKSSSPNSNDSTPPPRTNAMQALTATHNHTAEQLLPNNLNNSSVISESHLEHLNHHYTSAIGGGHLVHHHNQPNQHYSYNQQSTGGTNQHQLNIATQDQIYAHQQHLQHHHNQQQQQQHHLQTNANNHQQSIYHQISNNSVINGAIDPGYNHHATGAQYHGQLQSNSGGHPANNLINDSHQSQLNTAAAACAAAAVVSQTLKTVANQHNQHHHEQYNGHLTNGFGSTTGNLINMTAQHHQQFHTTTGTIGHHHHSNQAASSIQQQQHHTHHHANTNDHIHNNQSQQHQTTQLQSSRSLHQATSMVTRKYQCKMCPQVFMSKAEMKYHNQNHMREAKPYKCLQCPKAFANSSYLSQHMRIHQGVKPYNCDICLRKFTQLSHLQQHKRTHTGDKPYKCQYPNCTKQFSQLSNLQSHSRCHQLDKPYKCNSCYKCFQDELSLLEHIPRHLESKHLKKNLCIFCGSSYQQERGLVKHFQQYHTDKTPTLVAAAIAAGTTGNTSLIASLISSTQSNTVFATPSSGGTTSISNSGSNRTISSMSNSNNNNNNNNGSGSGGSSASSTSSTSSSSNSYGTATNLGNSSSGSNNQMGQNSIQHGANAATGGYQVGSNFF